MEHIYEKNISDSVKTLMWQVMKNSSQVVQGFIFFRNRTIIKAHYDKEGCDKLLKEMVINQENVLRYLRRKYIPHWNENGCIFKDQSCIQKVIIREDGTLYMHIKNSEPHKIITDSVHVMGLLRAKGLEFSPDIKYYIEQVKIAFQDVMLYNLCLTEWGYKVPSPAKLYERQIMSKYGKLEAIAGVKKRSIKRKYLRYWVKRGQMDWPQLRRLINMGNDDYNPTFIRHICKEIREENRACGITVEY